MSEREKQRLIRREMERFDREAPAPKGARAGAVLECINCGSSSRIRVIAQGPVWVDPADVDPGIFCPVCGEFNPDEVEDYEH